MRLGRGDGRAVTCSIPKTGLTMTDLHLTTSSMILHAFDIAVNRAQITSKSEQAQLLGNIGGEFTCLMQSWERAGLTYNPDLYADRKARECHQTEFFRVLEKGPMFYITPVFFH